MQQRNLFPSSQYKALLIIEYARIFSEKMD